MEKQTDKKQPANTGFEHKNREAEKLTEELEAGGQQLLDEAYKIAQEEAARKGLTI